MMTSASKEAFSLVALAISASFSAKYACSSALAVAIFSAAVALLNDSASISLLDASDFEISAFEWFSPSIASAFAVATEIL
jgi:hypothetical protein